MIHKFDKIQTYGLINLTGLIDVMEYLHSINYIPCEILKESKRTYNKLFSLLNKYIYINLKIESKFKSKYMYFYSSYGSPERISTAFMISLEITGITYKPVYGVSYAIIHNTTKYNTYLFDGFHTYIPVDKALYVPSLDL